MRLWAIWWGHPRGGGYIDYLTVRSTRRDAWAAHTAGVSEHSTPMWLAEMKRRRRNGLIKAVRIKIEVTK
jgi:hypothetical protein